MTAQHFLKPCQCLKPASFELCVHFFLLDFEGFVEQNFFFAILTGAEKRGSTSKTKTPVALW